MALGLPARKSFTTSKGHDYSYVLAPARDNKPTLLFIHGFPSQLCDWAYQIRHFSALGYGVIACDLLGFGESSKSTDVNDYRIKAISNELAELLDGVSLPQVIGIGHDLGAAILSRFAAYHPSRFSALVFLTVGPPKMGSPFDCEMINTMTKKMMGFELLGYIPWLGGKQDDAVQETLEKHPEAVMSLMFPSDASVWTEWFHPLGKMEQFVKEDKRVKVADWYPEELQQQHLAAYSREGGYTGVTRWYQMWHDNLFAPDEEGLANVQITQPSLVVVPKEPAAMSAQQAQMLGEWTPNLKVVEVNTGHWVHLEAVAETNAAIEELLSQL